MPARQGQRSPQESFDESGECDGRRPKQCPDLPGSMVVRRWPMLNVATEWRDRRHREADEGRNGR